MMRTPTRSHGQTNRTLLGADQETWLDGAIGAASSAWTVLASPVMFAGLDARHDDTDVEEPTYYLESWDGYVLHSVNAQMWRATFRTVVDIWDPDSVVETTAEYTVDSGARNAEPV